jgi:hypothetical protein
MSTNRSIGRSASTQAKVRSTSKSKKDRSTNLCAFTFADGRQCRTPRCSGHLHLCYFHAQKEAERLAAKQVGEDISRFLPAKLLTACDLGVALSRTFCAVAQGQIKPKVASTLGYLAQTMLQSIPIAQHEYCEALGTDYWRSAVRSSFHVNAPEPKPAPPPATQPAPPPRPPASQPTPVEAGRNSSRPAREPGSSASSSSTSTPAPQPPVNCHSEPAARREESASSSNSSLACPPWRATHHSPLPQPPQSAPPPHTPLPSTSTEFAQQVLAGRNSSRSEIPPEPSRETRSPGPSPSPAHSPVSPSSGSPPDRTSSTQPAPSSPCTLPTPNNSQPAPAPPAPPPVPPGFGAPANWDVLIPPKPRRRFSRHWQFRE